MERNFDVVVVGGGWGGVVAAVAAARQGAKTLILEKDICFGGTATCSQVCEIDGSYTRDGRCVLPAIGKEIIQLAIDRGAARRDGYIPMSSDPDHGCDRIRFNPEEMKLIMDQVVQQAGVTVLFHAAPQEIKQVSGGVEIAFGAPYNRISVIGKVLVDATGNSEAVYLLDPEATEKTDRNTLQGVTMIYRLGNVDMERYMTNITPEKLTQIMEKGLAEGRMSVRILASCPLPGMNEVSFSVTRAAGVDVEDPESFTRGVLETRTQIQKSLPFLKENMAGLERAHLSSIATTLGVRERRRIVGMKELKGDSLVAAQVVEDAVAFGCYPVDIHRATKEKAVQFTKIEGDGIYSIPYSCMVSSKYPNVIAGCKAIYSDVVAFAAHRTMPSVMGIGNAAGVAAAIAAREGTDLRMLDPSRIQNIIRSDYPDCDGKFHMLLSN